MELLIIVSIMAFISLAGCVWCVRSTNKKFGKPSAKVIKMNRDLKDLLDHKLDMDYQKTKSC
jgi:hypothetical protein